MDKETFISKKIYQIIDGRLRYRSILNCMGEKIDYVSDDKRDALVYTLDEANKIARYYIDELNVPVMIHCRIANRKSEI